eukprot:1524513-Rhodomonas_salina.1
MSCSCWYRCAATAQGRTLLTMEVDTDDDGSGVCVRVRASVVCRFGTRWLRSTVCVVCVGTAQIDLQARRQGGSAQPPHHRHHRLPL